MFIARLVGTALLSYFFVIGAIHNVKVLRRSFTRKDDGSFGVPFIPGIAGVGAILISPFPSIYIFAWVPLILDFGCLPYLIVVSTYLIIDSWKHSHFNLLARYVATVENRRVVTLSLYKKDCILQQNILRQPSEFGIAQSSTLGLWQESPERLMLEVGEKNLVLQKDGNVLREVGGSLYEDSEDLSLTGLIFEREKN